MKKKEIKEVKYSISSIFYGDCPHCKAPIVFSNPETVKYLKKWKAAKTRKYTKCRMWIMKTTGDDRCRNCGKWREEHEGEEL